MHNTGEQAIHNKRMAGQEGCTEQRFDYTYRGNPRMYSDMGPGQDMDMGMASDQGTRMRIVDNHWVGRQVALLYECMDCHMESRQQ